MQYSRPNENTPSIKFNLDHQNFFSSIRGNVSPFAQLDTQMVNNQIQNDSNKAQGRDLLKVPQSSENFKHYSDKKAKQISKLKSNSSCKKTIFKSSGKKTLKRRLAAINLNSSSARKLESH